MARHSTEKNVLSFMLYTYLYKTYSPATTVSARCNRIKTCSISPTSVQACKLRTLLRNIAMKTLHISAWKKRNEQRKNTYLILWHRHSIWLHIELRPFTNRWRVWFYSMANHTNFKWHYKFVTPKSKCIKHLVIYKWFYLNM